MPARVLRDSSGLRQSSGRRGCGLHERDRVRIEVAQRKFLKELVDNMLSPEAIALPERKFREPSVCSLCTKAGAESASSHTAKERAEIEQLRALMKTSTLS